MEICSKAIFLTLCAMNQISYHKTDMWHLYLYLYSTDGVVKYYTRVCVCVYIAHKTAVCRNLPTHNFIADRKTLIDLEQTNM